MKKILLGVLILTAIIAAPLALKSDAGKNYADGEMTTMGNKVGG